MTHHQSNRNQSNRNQSSGIRLGRAVSSTGMVLALGMIMAACQEAETPKTPIASQSNASNPASSAADTKHLKLGALLPSTGDLGSLGGPMIASVPILVETVNQCGGVNGESVKLVSSDDQTDPAAGTEAVNRLVSVEKVAGIVGSFSSGVSMAAAKVASRNKVMMVSPGSTSPDFTTKAKEFNGYWARTAPSDAYQAPALAKLAYDRGFRKVATIVINNDYGIGFEKEFITAFKAMGGTIVNEAKPTRYDAKATTLKTEATEVFGTKPDAVAAVMYLESGSLLLKSAYEQGVSQNIPVLVPDGMYSDDLAQKVGQTKDGKFIAAGIQGTIPGADGTALANFSKIWEAKLKRPVGAYAAHSWDAGALLVLAAQASKQNTGEGIQSKIREVANGPGEVVSDVCEGLKLLKAGKSINYQGASGNVDLDANGDVLGSYDIWGVKEDGKIGKLGNVKPNAKPK
jgi:neutral amino acid transport system substrate-binding protein